MVISTIIEDICGTKDAIITNGPQNSVITITKGKIRVIYGFNLDTGRQYTTSSKTCEIITKPALPDEWKTEQLLLSKEGNFLAIIGSHEVYILGVHFDLVAYALEPEKLKSVYYCEAVPLIKEKYGKKVKIQKVLWAEEESFMKGNGVGVLLRNNVVEIFNASKPAEPGITGDFRPACPTSNNTFGVNNCIETFAWGPMIADDITNGVHYSLFAVDSDGQIHTVSISKGENKQWASNEIRKSTQIHGLTSKNLLMDISDILFLNNTHKSRLPMFAIVTLSGNLIHAVVTPTSQMEWIDGNVSFELFAVESTSFSQFDGKQENGIHLLNDPVSKNHYLLYGSRGVYSVDYTRSVNNLVADIGHHQQEKTATNGLIFHQIFNCSKQVIPHSVGVLPLEKMGISDLPVQTVMLFGLVEDQGLVVHCVNRQLLRADAKLNIHGKPLKISTETENQQPLINEIIDILSQRQILPVFQLDDKSNERTKAQILISAFNVALGNDKILKSSMEKLDQNINSIPGRTVTVAEALEKEHVRISEFYDDLVEIKNNVKLLRDEVCVLSGRLDGVLEKISPSDDVAILSDEIRIYEDLMDFKAKLEEYQESISEMSEEINEKKALFFGETKSFQATPVAQKFMLQKTTQDLENLTTWIKKLKTDADELFA
uniref:DNA damage-binding protein 1 n=1 Tax=Rhabditophanes sp. KR3021 TaxID=114890 RepID=A0AC35UEM7_9BILA